MAHVSNEKVVEATGRTWQEWFGLLDKVSAKDWQHKEIADWLYDHHLKKSWWCQSVTVEYERARGLRQLHETTAGFQISASKTLGRSIAELYNVFEKLEHADWTTKHENKTLRGKYFDTRLEVYLEPKSGSKTQAVIQQTKLENAKDAEHMKAHWKKYLESLDG